MIYFLDASGSVARCVPERIFQGSSQGNKLLLVAPAENAEAYAAFRLPDGRTTARLRLEREGEAEGLYYPEGRGVCCWGASLSADVTARYGTVLVQFFLYGAGGEISASASAQFTVERGVPVAPPETPEQDAYAQLLAAVSGLRADLTNGYYAARAAYAWNADYAYGANEIVFYPDFGEYGAFVRSVASGNRGNAPYTGGEIDAAHWAEVVNFDHIARDYLRELSGLAASARAAEQSATAAGEASATAKASAEQSALSAENSALSAAESQKTAVSSASNATENARSAAASAAKAEADAGAAQNSAQTAAEAAETAKRYAEAGIQPNTDYKSVSELPRPGSTKFLYLIPNTNTEAADSYGEYIWVPDKGDYEFVGSTKIELADYAKQSGNYPNLTAGLAAGLSRTVELNTSGSNAVGWYKLGEITASALSGLVSGSNNYSAILLVNGNGYAGLNNAMPSGIIEIDGRLENGSFNANGYPQIKILAGNLNAQSFCMICAGEKQEIYYSFSNQYERTFFTVLSETYGSSVVNAFVFGGTYYGSAAPSGATYAINRIYAGFDANGNDIANTYAPKEYYLKTYTGISQLGLSFPCTTVEILNKMESNTFLLLNVEDRAQQITDAPTSYGLLMIWKKGGNRVEVTFQQTLSSGHIQFEGIWAYESNAFTGISWQEFAYRNGTYPEMTVGNATRAAQDSEGNEFTSVYAKKSDVAGGTVLLGMAGASYTVGVSTAFLEDYGISSDALAERNGLLLALSSPSAETICMMRANAENADSFRGKSCSLLGGGVVQSFEATAEKDASGRYKLTVGMKKFDCAEAKELNAEGIQLTFSGLYAI